MNRQVVDYLPVRCTIIVINDDDADDTNKKCFMFFDVEENVECVNDIIQSVIISDLFGGEKGLN